MTNGSLITDEIAKLFSENNVYVQVSLDGTKDIYQKIRCNSSYERTLKGLNFLKKYQVNTDLSFLPSKLTIQDFENVVEVAKKYNISAIHMPFLELHGRAAENEDVLKIDENLLIKFMEKVINEYYSGKYGDVKIGFIQNMTKQLLHPTVQSSCKACRETILGLDYNEKIFPCSELIMKDYCIGSLDNSLEKIHQTFRIMIKDISQIDVNNISKCKTCEFKVLCGGGCRVQALIGGNIEKEDTYCEVLKCIYRSVLEHIVKK